MPANRNFHWMLCSRSHEHVTDRGLYPETVTSSERRDAKARRRRRSCHGERLSRADPHPPIMPPSRGTPRPPSRLPRRPSRQPSAMRELAAEDWADRSSASPKRPVRQVASNLEGERPAFGPLLWRIADRSGWSLYGAPGSQAMAISRTTGRPNRGNRPKSVATACPRLPFAAHGKEGGRI